MRMSGYIAEGALDEARQAADLAVELGLSRIWTGELAHDPFLPLAFAASAQPGLGVGTGIAVCFARSPFVVAEVARDLAKLSRGNFVLGIGTQVRAHIQRRFGMTWQSPMPWLRDYVGALRAIFESWEHGTPLSHEGPYFKLDLLPEKFNPGPLGLELPRIYLSGVNRGVCGLAGEIADGFIAHAYNSPDYLRQVVLPQLRACSRDVPLVATAIVGLATNDRELEAERERVRSEVAFYASTPSYRVILETHALEDLGRELSILARAGRWAELPGLVDDDVLETFAVVGTPTQVGAELHRRYAGIADEVAPIRTVDEQGRDGWVDLLASFAAAARGG